MAIPVAAPEGAVLPVLGSCRIAGLRLAYTGRDSSPIYFLWEINRKVAMGPYPSPNSPPGCWI